MNDSQFDTRLPEQVDLREAIGEVSIALPDSMSFDQWLQTGQQLLRWHESLSFALGDLLIFGIAHFGEEAAQLIDERHAETCRKAKYVCERIPVERRRLALTFRHHDAVASLPPETQDELLLLAERRGWTSRVLRHEAAERKATLEADKTPPEQTAHYRWPAGMEPVPGTPASGLVKVRPVEPPPPANDFEKAPSETEQEDLARAREIVSAVVVPPATEDHSVHLYSIARTTTSSSLSVPLLAILEERAAMLKVVAAAREAVLVGQITPELVGALLALPNG